MAGLESSQAVFQAVFQDVASIVDLVDADHATSAEEVAVTGVQKSTVVQDMEYTAVLDEELAASVKPC